MKKLRNKMGLAFLATVATTLTACGNKGGVTFWSSFGTAYANQVSRLCAMAEKQTGIEIAHESKGSYPEIRRQMISAIAAGDYPSIATGYPDHLVCYLEHNILTPLDSYFSAAEKNDYYEHYLKENTFYDNSGKGVQRLYGVPFNKSTEILAYNGVFVDYAKQVDPSIDKVPETWQEWETYGPKFRTVYDNICGHKLYGKQNADLSLKPGAALDSPSAGSVLIDLTGVEKEATYLLGYDATDNAFITLLRQWGAEYTSLADSEAKKPAGRRVGHARFTDSTNSTIAANCFKFFSGLYKQRIFCIPGDLDDSYCSGPFAQWKCMFMISSSGGLSHNTSDGKFNLTLAPIPYYSKDGVTRKYVIAQGANLCITDAGDTKKAVKVVKALTSGDIQTEWCLQTGYFPGSKKAAENQKYKDFLAGKNIKTNLQKIFRQGALVNSNVYQDKSNGWTSFVDPAFVGSAVLREKCGDIFQSLIQVNPSSELSAWKSILNALKNVDDLRLGTLQFD